MAHIINMTAMTDGYVTFVCLYLQYKFSTSIYQNICHCCHSSIIHLIYHHITTKKVEHEIRISMSNSNTTSADDTQAEVHPFI